MENPDSHLCGIWWLQGPSRFTYGTQWLTVIPNIPMSKTIRYKESNHICIFWIPEMKKICDSNGNNNYWIYIYIYHMVYTYTVITYIHIESYIFLPNNPCPFLRQVSQQKNQTWAQIFLPLPIPREKKSDDSTRIESSPEKRKKKQALRNPLSHPGCLMTGSLQWFMK